MVSDKAGVLQWWPVGAREVFSADLEIIREGLFCNYVNQMMLYSLFCSCHIISTGLYPVIPSDSSVVGFSHQIWSLSRRGQLDAVYELNRFVSCDWTSTHENLTDAH